jgi:DHA2 family multidrug resistance protein
MMAIGFISFGCGTWIMTHVTTDWDFYELLIPQVLRGFGLMMCMVPINNIALGTLPPARIRNASGLFNLTRNLGGAVGLAVINTLLSQRTDDHYVRLAEHVSYSNPQALEWLNNVGANYDSYGLHGFAAGVDTRLCGCVLRADAAVRQPDLHDRADPETQGGAATRRGALNKIPSHPPQSWGRRK